MNDARNADTLAKTLSSASEISYVDYDVAKKLAARIPVDLNASLLSSAPGPAAHTFTTYAPPLVKETRQERSSSVLIGELESNCNTVSRLASLISTDSQAMSKYVEQAKHTLSLSASATSVAALGNMKAILDTVSDSSTGSSDKANSDKATSIQGSTLPEARHKSDDGSTSTFTEPLNSTSSLHQPPSEALPRFSTAVSSYAFTPTGRQANLSEASPLQTTLCAKEIYQGDTQLAALTSPGPYNQTPEPTFIRPHSVSLQSILSTGQAHLRPPPIREVPDEVIIPSTAPQQALLSSLPQVSHCADSSASTSTLPWRPGTTVQADNLPLPAIKNYFSNIERLDNLSINKINTEDCFPLDEGCLRRLQYEISAIRRYMNLNISARDAELARLDKEIQSLKLDRERQTSPVTDHTSIADRPSHSNQKPHIDESAVKVVFPSPFSVHSSNADVVLALDSTEASDINHAYKYSTPLASSDLGSLIVTPEMIENCFSSISSTLPGVSSLADTSRAPESYVGPAHLTSQNLQRSNSPDLIKEYTTGNLAELKAELARTRDEAMRIIREKDAEIAEMRRHLAATKSPTSTTASAAISLVSTLHDKASPLVETGDVQFSGKSTSDRSELLDKCDTPLPRAVESDSLQISALPISSTAVLASVTHPEDTCSNLSAESIQTVVYSGAQPRHSPHYSISVSSTSNTSLDRSISLTEDQSSLSSKLTTSKLGTSYLKLALSTVAKSGTIPPKPPSIGTFLPLTYSTDTPLHDEYLPSPSSSRSDSVEAAPKHRLVISESHTPMSASPAQTGFEQNRPGTTASTGPRVTFMTHSSLGIPQASHAPEPLVSSGSLMSNSSYLYDMDTGDQRDDEFLQLEQEVKVIQSQLVRSLASTYLSDTYRSSDFAGVVIDTFSAPPPNTLP